MTDLIDPDVLAESLSKAPALRPHRASESGLSSEAIGSTMVIHPRQSQSNKPTIGNRASVATMDTYSSSGSSAYTRFDDTFSNPRFSVASSSSSFSDARLPLIKDGQPQPQPRLLKHPEHDATLGLWNATLRVIPCGTDHSNLRWWQDSATRCSVCGFTRWHALMVHARSMSCDDFSAANWKLHGIDRVDYAGNSFHYLMIAGVGINHLIQVFDSTDTCQNFFGQNPLHVLNSQDLGDHLISLLEWYERRHDPAGKLLSQHDIYCRTPLHTLLQQPFERPIYRQLLNAFSSPVPLLCSFDTTGKSVFELMHEASLKAKSQSITDFLKIQAGIAEAKNFLSDVGDQSICAQTYGFHDIARGAHGTLIFGLIFQCPICKESTAHWYSYLEQIECAIAHGRDRNAPDESGWTPVHLLVTQARCNTDFTPETPSQTAALFRKLVPKTCPESLEILHTLDPEGNSLIHNIAVRGLDEILEYALSLETDEKRRWMVDSAIYTQNGTQSTLTVVEDEIKLVSAKIRFVNAEVFLVDKLGRLNRVKSILISAGTGIPRDGVSMDAPGTAPSTESSRSGQALKYTAGIFEGIRQAVSGPRGSLRGAPSTSETTTTNEKIDHPESVGLHAPAIPGPEVGSTKRIFPIDAQKDVQLISLWHKHALPTLKGLLCNEGDSSVSITLLRRGRSQDDSSPIVRIQTSTLRSEEQRGAIRQAIYDVLHPLESPPILFTIGKVRRTATRSDLDVMPCTAQNTAFSPKPPMGVSIGIDGSVKDTATLGGYIYIDNVPHILTVHHLFTDENTGSVYQAGTVITQPSLQEVKEFAEIWDHVKSTEECFHLACVKALFERIRKSLDAFSFGTLVISSGFRNRLSRDGISNFEMDWAVCKIDSARIGSNVTPCEKHWCRDASPVVPGAAVFSVGRTTGCQDGIVNGDMTRLFLSDDDGEYRESDEWSVVRSHSTPEQTWVRSGIGASGDSGAWILEASTDNVIGQLWGRDFKIAYSNEAGDEDGDEDGNIITYFTPIHEIFDDIKDFTGAAQVTICADRDFGQMDNEPGAISLNSGTVEFSGVQCVSKDSCRICTLSVSKWEAEDSIASLANEITLLRVAGDSNQCLDPRTSGGDSPTISGQFMLTVHT